MLRGADAVHRMPFRRIVVFTKSRRKPSLCVCVCVCIRVDRYWFRIFLKKNRFFKEPKKYETLSSLVVKYFFSFLLIFFFLKSSLWTSEEEEFKMYFCSFNLNYTWFTFYEYLFDGFFFLSIYNRLSSSSYATLVSHYHLRDPQYVRLSLINIYELFFSSAFIRPKLIVNEKTVCWWPWTWM